jgi:hypothetical protein
MSDGKAVHVRGGRKETLEKIASAIEQEDAQ